MHTQPDLPADAPKWAHTVWAVLAGAVPEAKIRYRGIQKATAPHVCIEVVAVQWPVMADALRLDPRTWLDSLTCITGLDLGTASGQMELAYTLYSIPLNLWLTVYIVLPRPEADALSVDVPSVSSVWATAEWHEREVYDLLGIPFSGHPDLRRILLPADWKGYPLRKDYQHQETYHGLTVRYERD